MASKAIRHMRATAPQWLKRIEVREGERIRHRFWQPGGGYDRNITSSKALRAMNRIKDATFASYFEDFPIAANKVRSPFGK